MKILASYASEYDTGEGRHYVSALRRLGHTVIEANVPHVRRQVSGSVAMPGFPANATLNEILTAVDGADLFLYLEPMGVIPGGLAEAPVPTACALSDLHRNRRARQQVGQLFDHVFVYHRNHLSAFADRPPGTVHWLPFACDTEMVKDLDVPRDLDVAFVGRLYTPERRKTIGQLSARYRLNEQRSYRQSEIPAIYSSAKIVVNLPSADDIPFRVFEAMSCGALLLTRRVDNGLDELFTDGVHYVSFADSGELFERIDHLLAHDDERRAIAAAGRAEILLRHTPEIRMTRLLELVAAGPAAAAPVRQMTSQQQSVVHARALERSGRVDALLSLAARETQGATKRLLLWHAARATARRALVGW